MLARDENEFQPEEKILVPALWSLFRNFICGNNPHSFPVLLLCRRLPNRNNFFVLFCLLTHFRGKQFIPDTHICCFGTPSPRPLQATSVRCCGRNAFDLDRKSCCRGSIQPLGYPCGCRGKKKTDPDRLCPL